MRPLPIISSTLLEIL